MNTDKHRSEVGSRRSEVRSRISCFLFLCALCVLCGESLASATTITGSIKDPAGAGITGTLELRLSAPGRVADPALLLVQPKVICAVTSGSVAGGCVVRGNDTITEAGTYYCVRMLGSAKQELMSGKKYTITGATFDVGAVAPGITCK